jgi:hypothetical protein
MAGMREVGWGAPARIHAAAAASPSYRLQMALPRVRVQPALGPAVAATTTVFRLVALFSCFRQRRRLAHHDPSSAVRPPPTRSRPLTDAPQNIRSVIVATPVHSGSDASQQQQLGRGGAGSHRRIARAERREAGFHSLVCLLDSRGRGPGELPDCLGTLLLSERVLLRLLLVGHAPCRTAPAATAVSHSRQPVCGAPLRQRQSIVDNSHMHTAAAATAAATAAAVGGRQDAPASS